MESPGIPGRFRLTKGASAHITVCIGAPSEPNGITLDVSADRRVVIPEVVVVLPGLLIVVLSRESEVVGIFRSEVIARKQVKSPR